MTLGTRPGPMVALFLNVRPDRLRDWKRRGLIGRTCDVRTKKEGYDVNEANRVLLSLSTTRPRQTLDNEAWRSHAERVVGLCPPRN